MIITNLYYKCRDGSEYTMVPKEELKRIIDPYNPDSYLPYLEAMNYPYFEEEWNLTRDNLARQGFEYIKYTLSKYIAKMNLKAYKPFTWEDNSLIKELTDSKPKLFFNELEKLRRTKMTTTDFLKIYDNYPEDLFDEEILQDLWCNGLFTDDENVQDITEVEYSEQERWSHLESRVIKVQDRYFEIARWAGNTEYQDNTYDCQPVEVRLVEKLVKVWEAVE